MKKCSLEMTELFFLTLLFVIMISMFVSKMLEKIWKKINENFEYLLIENLILLFSMENANVKNGF